MSWKSKSIIPFLFIKIYHENCSVDHDVPTRQNAHNWTFSGKGTSLYPTWMYFSMYDNVLESKLGTTAIIIRWFVTVSPWFVKNCPHATISFLRWFCTLKHMVDIALDGYFLQKLSLFFQLYRLFFSTFGIEPPPSIDFSCQWCRPQSVKLIVFNRINLLYSII